MKPAVIITSIFPPNDVMREIATRAGTNDWTFIIAGDSKSPRDFSLEGAVFLDIDSQREASAYGRACPERTYARKNTAYLHAIKNDAPWIIETDDDNMPRDGFWKKYNREIAGRKLDGEGWQNAYRYFSEKFIYPRGYPISRALPDWEAVDSDTIAAMGNVTADCMIQQYLADENPDVDAIYRMLHPLPFNFDDADPLILGENVWCPFNSQNTVFFPEAYPLLYLPATCSFRMTDIWRSFIAQRILWTCGWRLSFHSPTVYQERNEHDLLRDFEDEISGYLGNEKIISTLTSLQLQRGPENLRVNLEKCYEILTKEGFFDPLEEELLKAWLDDIGA